MGVGSAENLHFYILFLEIQVGLFKWLLRTSCCIFFRHSTKQCFPFLPCHLHTWNKSASWLKKDAGTGEGDRHNSRSVVIQLISVAAFTVSYRVRSSDSVFFICLMITVFILKNRRSVSPCCCWYCILYIAQVLTFYFLWGWVRY